MKGSKYLLRANPALTTNVKLVCDSKYNLYLESYSSNPELSDNRFKMFAITPDSFLSERIASFYKGMPTDTAYAVRNDISSDTIQDKYDLQFDDIYYSGARYVEDTRHEEEFQYNTTLKVDARNLPKMFVIFRADGPGIMDASVANTGALIESLKVVQAFDLTSNTAIGKLWKKNYIDDDTIPDSPFELNLKRFEFSKWNGYDYFTGGTVSKSFFMDEFFRDEDLHFETESFITDGFKRNGVVSSNYLNVSYLFDDTVSDVFEKYDQASNPTEYPLEKFPFIKTYVDEGLIDTDKLDQAMYNIHGVARFNDFVPYRKRWTMNRYFGFYVDDLVKIDSVSPYAGSAFRVGQDIEITENLFTIDNAHVDPTLTGWDKTKVVHHFKIGDKFYLVDRAEVNGQYRYTIVSDTLFDGLMDSFIEESQRPVKIVYSKHTSGRFYPYLMTLDNEYYRNRELERYGSSVLFIDIAGHMYKIGLDNGKVFVNTEHYITCDGSTLRIADGFNAEKNISTRVVTSEDDIMYFDIYLCKFTEVSDWDFNRTRTRYADIEYESATDVNYSRPFMYSIRAKDTSGPVSEYFETGYSITIRIGQGAPQLKFSREQSYILPLSSEYAHGDLYMLDKLDRLSRIWDVNQSVNKWGYFGSVNNSSYPYKLNNSLSVSGMFNFTPNLYEKNVDLAAMNLDWFYTPGFPASLNLSTGILTQEKNILNRTLNLDLPYVQSWGAIPNHFTNFFKMTLDAYKSRCTTFDYFEYLMGMPVRLDNTAGVYRKYNRIARFTESDGVNGPAVFFKGLNAHIRYVNCSNPNSPASYSTTPADDLSGYGFSILFDNRETTNASLHGQAGVEIVLNKIHKNVLVNIFLYTPFKSITSLHYRRRDLVYGERFVEYTVFDTNTGVYRYVASQLPVTSLTLNRFIDLLNPNTPARNDFRHGVKYTVVEHSESWQITSVSAVNKTVTIKLDRYNDCKHSDWIYIMNTGIAALDNKNHQVVNKMDNRTLQIELDSALTLTSGQVQSSILYGRVSGERSVLPFILTVREPEFVHVDRSANVLVGDTSCPVFPVNNAKNNPNVTVSTLETDGILPHVYVSDDIGRRIRRNRRNRELTYSEIDSLPVMYRYSGPYEPILSDMSLFGTQKLVALTVPENYIPYSSNYFTKPEDGRHRLCLTVEPGTDFVKNFGLRVGDVFYVTNDYGYTDGIIHLTGTVHSFRQRDDVPSYWEIETSIMYDSDLGHPMSNPCEFETNIWFYRPIDGNTYFDFNYKDFGVMKDLVVAKVYEGINPLKTSHDTYKTSSRFPMIDEHGSTTVDRYIFKSSWDNDFYYKTDSNTY
jgi:hypothetical protein